MSILKNKIDFVEPRSFKETLSEVDRAGTAGIFCNAPHEVRENGKADGNHQRRCTGSDRHSGKRNIHRRHMSRGSCKYVVKVNIGKAEQDECCHPIHSGEHRGKSSRHPFNETERCETGC